MKRDRQIAKIAQPVGTILTATMRRPITARSRLAQYAILDISKMSPGEQLVRHVMRDALMARVAVMI
jgi:hypothetical protein